MLNDYMNIFPHVFFDIEQSPNTKSTITQVDNIFSSIIVRYGELLNEISYNESQQDNFVDSIICLFIRKIMEQLDAINILYSVGSCAPTKILLRTLIESIISLKFILKQDTPKRAAAYYLEHHYQEIELGRSCLNPNSSLAKITKRLGEECFNDFQKQYQQKQSALQRLIQHNLIFQEIDKDRREKIKQKKESTKLSSSKQKIKIQWYEVCSNASTFYDLMKETGYKDYYRGLYGGLSYETHSLNSAMGMEITENGFFLKKIRNLEDAHCTFSLTCSISMSLLKDLYKYLNDGEEEKQEFKLFFIDYEKQRKHVEKDLYIAEDSICSKLI